METKYQLIIEHTSKIEMQMAIADMLTDRFIDRILNKINPGFAKVGPGFLPRREFAEKYRLSLRTIDNRIADGLLETKRLGRRVFIKDNFFQNNQEGE